VGQSPIGTLNRVKLSTDLGSLLAHRAKIRVYAVLAQGKDRARHRLRPRHRRAIALKLAEAGASVMLNDIDREPLFETGALIDSTGEPPKALPGDITAPEFPQKLVDATVSGFGSIDIIVNKRRLHLGQRDPENDGRAVPGDAPTSTWWRRSGFLRAASGYIREAAKRETAEGRRVMRKVVNVTSVRASTESPGRLLRGREGGHQWA